MNTVFLLMAQFEKALLTVQDVAMVFHLAPKTVQNRLAAGTFPIAPIKAAGHTYFRIQDLADYIDSQVQQGNDATRRPVTTDFRSNRFTSSRP